MDRVEAAIAKKMSRLRSDLWAAVAFGIFEGLEKDDIIPYGVSATFRGGDVLLTIKGVRAGERVVSFCGAGDWEHALVKAAREANAGKLHWRADKYSEG